MLKEIIYSEIPFVNPKVRHKCKGSIVTTVFVDSTCTTFYDYFLIQSSQSPQDLLGTTISLHFTD